MWHFELCEVSQPRPGSRGAEYFNKIWNFMSQLWTLVALNDNGAKWRVMQLSFRQLRQICDRFNAACRGVTA